jgi:hypothetical protein
VSASFAHLSVLALVASSCAFAPASATTLVHASPAANLVYQLDCVSHRIKSCGNRNGYTALWRIRFNIDVAHDEGVAAWARLRPHPRDANGALEASRTDPALLRTASFGIDSIDRFVARLPEFLDSADLVTARDMIERVRPEFDDWWNDRAEVPLAKQVVILQKAFRSSDIDDELADMHRFFGLVQSNDTALSVELVRRVAPSYTTSAESLGRYAIVEIGDDEAATLHMPVVVHEYVHYLFRRMPRERFAALHARVLGADSAPHRSLERVGAWNLFNEALATAIGNGRVARSITPDDFAWRVARHRGLYNDDDVDAAAKALLPIIDWMFEAGHSINDPAFADAYVDALSRTMRPRLRAPALVLQELAALADVSLADSDGTFMPAIQQAFPSNHSLWSYRVRCCGQDFERPWSDHAGKQPRLAIVPVERRHEVLALQNEPKLDKPGYSIRIVDGLPYIVIGVHSAAEVAPILARIAVTPSLTPGDYDEPAVSITRTTASPSSPPPQPPSSD